MGEKMIAKLICTILVIYGVLLITSPPSSASYKYCLGNLVYELHGRDGRLQWKSYYTKEKTGDFCFGRFVEVATSPPEEWVRWVVAGLKDWTEIVGRLDLGFCCDDEEGSQIGDLEYGHLGKGMKTEVIRGEDEPVASFPTYIQLASSSSSRLFLKPGVVLKAENHTQVQPAYKLNEESWAAVSGIIKIGDSEINLDLRFISRYKDLSEGKGLEYKYDYEIINKGDLVIADWRAVKSRIFADVGYPIKAESGKFSLNASSKFPPVRKFDDLIISTIDNIQIIHITAPGFLPNE